MRCCFLFVIAVLVMSSCTQMEHDSKIENHPQPVFGRGPWEEIKVDVSGGVPKQSDPQGGPLDSATMDAVHNFGRWMQAEGGYYQLAQILLLAALSALLGWAMDCSCANQNNDLAKKTIKEVDDELVLAKKLAQKFEGVEPSGRKSIASLIPDFAELENECRQIKENKQKEVKSEKRNSRTRASSYLLAFAVSVHAMFCFAWWSWANVDPGIAVCVGTVSTFGILLCAKLYGIEVAKGRNKTERQNKEEDNKKEEDEQDRTQDDTTQDDTNNGEEDSKKDNEDKKVSCMSLLRSQLKFLILLALVIFPLIVPNFWAPKQKRFWIWMISVGVAAVLFLAILQFARLVPDKKKSNNISRESWDIFHTLTSDARPFVVVLLVWMLLLVGYLGAWGQWQTYRSGVLEQFRKHTLPPSAFHTNLKTLRINQEYGVHYDAESLTDMILATMRLPHEGKKEEKRLDVEIAYLLAYVLRQWEAFHVLAGQNGPCGKQWLQDWLADRMARTDNMKLLHDKYGVPDDIKTHEMFAIYQSAKNSRERIAEGRPVEDMDDLAMSPLTRAYVRETVKKALSEKNNIRFSVAHMDHWIYRAYDAEYQETIADLKKTEMFTGIWATGQKESDR